MTEKEFQSQVLEAAKLFGWLSYHTHDSRRSAAGFPDLVLVRRERLLFAELKRDGERATAAQLAWLRALAVTPAEKYIWFPKDWNEITDILR